MPIPEYLAARVGAAPWCDEPVGGVAEWTAAELAMALAGLPRDVQGRWLSAWLWRYMGTNRSELYGWLMVSTIRLAEREKWPQRIGGERYLESFVIMAIDEDRMTNIDRQRLLERLVDKWGNQWAKHFSPKYEAVRKFLDDWTSACHYHAQKKLASGDE